MIEDLEKSLVKDQRHLEAARRQFSRFLKRAKRLRKSSPPSDYLSSPTYFNDFDRFTALISAHELIVNQKREILAHLRKSAEWNSPTIAE